MFRKILVATDGSSQGRNAVRRAGALAALCKADLHILHAALYHESPGELRQLTETEHLADFSPIQRLAEMKPPSATRDPQTDPDLMTVLANRIVEDAMNQATEAGAVKISTTVLEGDAADAILSEADRIDADLIVIGSRGLGIVKRLLMGSVAQRVSQLARCSCLMIR